MKAGRALHRVAPVKLLASLATVTLLGIVGVAGTQAALSDTTDNPGNEANAGEIDLSDNDSGGFLYQVDNAVPGDPPTEACIRVSYTGTPDLGSTVELYLGTPIGDVGPYVGLSIDVGSSTSTVFPDCTGFSSARTLYTGTLSDFQAQHGSAGSGVPYSPNGTDPWFDGDTVVYRVTVSLRDVPRPSGANFSGPHTYTWRADSV